MSNNSHPEPSTAGKLRDTELKMGSVSERKKVCMICIGDKNEIIIKCA